MQVRMAVPEDWPFIKDAHKRSGYGFTMPSPDVLRSVYVAEEDGQFVAAAGFEGVAQIVAVFNPSFSSAYRRMEVVKMLHAPIAREILLNDATSAYAFCDPRFPGFGRRLMRLGWSMKLWPCFFVDRPDIVRAYGEADKCA